MCVESSISRGRLANSAQPSFFSLQCAVRARVIVALTGHSMRTGFVTGALQRHYHSQPYPSLPTKVSLSSNQCSTGLLENKGNLKVPVSEGVRTTVKINLHRLHYLTTDNIGLQRCHLINDTLSPCRPVQDCRHGMLKVTWATDRWCCALCLVSGNGHIRPASTLYCKTLTLTGPSTLFTARRIIVK